MAGRAEWPLVLAYHHLSQSQTTRYVMTARAFERQLTRLLEAGLAPVSLETAVASGPFAPTPTDKPCFSLTFDDGLMSFKTHALPVLERLGLVGATALFVPTRHVGGANEWRSEPSWAARLRRRTDLSEPLLGWDDLSELSSAGVTIGSHGHGHLPMQELGYERAKHEAEQSRSALLGHGLAGRYFAYPFGWLDAASKQAVRDAGFEAAFSVTHGGGDPFEIRRVPVYGTDTLPFDRLKTSGSFFAAYDATRRLAGKGDPA